MDRNCKIGNFSGATYVKCRTWLAHSGAPAAGRHAAACVQSRRRKPTAARRTRPRHACHGRNAARRCSITTAAQFLLRHALDANIVTGHVDEPQAVLIRACADGANGPGKLTRRLQIDKAFNDGDITTCPELWIDDGRHCARDR